MLLKPNACHVTPALGPSEKQATSPFKNFLGVQGIQEKNVFFTIHCNPSLAYISVRDRQSSQSNTSVQSRILGGIFFVQQIAAKCWLGKGGKLSRILGKKQYSMNTLYVISYKMTSWKAWLYNLHIKNAWIQETWTSCNVFIVYGRLNNDCERGKFAILGFYNKQGLICQS